MYGGVTVRVSIIFGQAHLGGGCRCSNIGTTNVPILGRGPNIPILVRGPILGHRGPI